MEDNQTFFQALIGMQINMSQFFDHVDTKVD